MRYPFQLPKLPYAYDALEPHIDAATMELHHQKHHQGYIDKFNAAFPYKGGTNEISLEDLMTQVELYDVAVRNNGGGHYNHMFFWDSMSPQGRGEPKGNLLTKIKAQFGSLEGFKASFTQAAAAHFGSGWVWLWQSPCNTLYIRTTPNQDNPLMTMNPAYKGTPLLALDLWEHAYYLKYRNDRMRYIGAFWHVVNWPMVEERLEQAEPTSYYTKR